jgi:hypothetical protein
VVHFLAPKLWHGLDRALDVPAVRHHVLGPILQNSISAEKFSPSSFGQISTQKQQIYMFVHI